MKHLKTIAFVIIVAFFFNTLTAQNRWSAEFRPGIYFPTKSVGMVKLKTGFGFEVALSYKVMQHLNTYVGWGFNTFQTADDTLKIEFDLTGYTFGFHFIHPISKDSKLSYLMRAGVIYSHIKIENINGNIIQDTNHGIGYEFGTGLDFILGSNGWSLRPQVGYRALSRDLELLNTKTKVDLNYIVFALGVSKQF
ncbi:opacity protein [Lacinutrix neustonica]|uniref:Opacity protein n=1 Tax=Lacinutrix neustonica TaxID=2980107 RepID=A0A9E8MWA5_9FLAO|nr:outer membrane beta-barrel protein [Lacinutrix neustonica]WAC02773.1 opacity protein [Lacinutrix neustonica]